MKKEEALQAILREWEKQPESERQTENQAALFALGIMQDRPDLTKFRATGDRYQHIKGFLCRHLVAKKVSR